MELRRIAQIVNEKAHLYDDPDLVFVAQQLDLHASTVEPSLRTSPAALLSIPAAARLISVSPDWLWKLVAMGQLKSVKLGKRRLIRHADLVAFVTSHTTHNTNEGVM